MREKTDIKTLLRNNAVTIMFIIMCAVCFTFSGQSINYVIFELMSRLSRNAFIVLALIIPIVAGMGINFAITIGAMAAQIAILWVLEWQIPGIGGFLVAGLLSSGHNFPLGGNERILPLLHEAAYLIVP